MGTTASPRQLLNSICHNTHWEYAVLWKLKQMELTWEDGYFDNKTSGGFFGRKPGIISFGREIDIKSGKSVNFPIEMAVSSMSCHTFILGEGIIGKVASERKHRWINASEIDSTLQEKFSGEWNLQFGSGIKTILLVPVIPLGVVQLGSLDTILEDLREVIRISDYFGALQNTSATCTSLSSRADRLDSYMPLANIPLVVDVKDQVLGVDIDPNANEIEQKSTFSHLFPNGIEEPPALDLSLLAGNTTEGDLSTFSYLNDEHNVFSSISHRLISNCHTAPNHYTMDPEHKGHDHDFRKDFGEKEISIMDHKYLCFPSDSELHKALGLSSSGHEDCMWNAIVSKAGDWSSSIANPKFEDANAWSRKESETEQLLDAMVAELITTSDYNECDGPSCIRSCGNSSSKCSDSCLTQCKTEDDALDLKDSESRSNKRSMSALDSEGLTSSPNKSNIDVSLITEQQDVVYELYKKGTMPANIGRKRGNTADVRKPKPRDRQLIQERIKELRDLIPDGSKCSIDALLDRTVKHMLFLQSIPCQAEKLRHSAEPKVNGKHWNSSEFPTHQSEASWSYNSRRGSEQFPLIVENLDQPGQVLVEMQCEEYGLFLEMAQIIRRLKLTILKGVLETKSNKRLARFIVEIPRGFHRMDILWPLLQMLQRSNMSVAKMLY